MYFVWILFDGPTESCAELGSGSEIIHSFKIFFVKKKKGKMLCAFSLASFGLISLNKIKIKQLPLELNVIVNRVFLYVL